MQGRIEHTSKIIIAVLKENPLNYSTLFEYNVFKRCKGISVAEITPDMRVFEGQAHPLCTLISVRQSCLTKSIFGIRTGILQRSCSHFAANN